MRYLFFLLLISIGCEAQQSALMNNNVLLQADFNPTDLAAKMEFWFDNTDVSSLTIVNTDEVKSQTSQVGSLTRKANTDTDGSRPNYDAVNNEIHFDGTVDGFRLVGSLSATAKAGGEVFVVMRRDPIYTGSPEFFYTGDTTTASRSCLIRDRANDGTSANRSISMSYTNGATNNVARGNTRSLSDKVNIFNYRITAGSTYTLDFDDRGGIGETMIVGTNNGLWIDDLTAFNKTMFGMRHNGTANVFSSYYELEIIYFHTQLTTVERTEMYNYFNAKHHAYSVQSTTNIGVVLWGQSNAVGQGGDGERPNRLTTATTGVLDIFVWTSSGTFSQYGSANDGGNNFGLDLSLLFALAEYYRNGDIYMAKPAESSRALAVQTTRDFNIASSGELYDELSAKSLDLQTALDAIGPNIIFTIMVQGERDAREIEGGEPAAYEDNLNDILDELEVDGFVADYHIINKLNDGVVNSTSDPSDPIDADDLLTVQTAQEAVVAARSNAYLLDMNNFTLDPADFTHFVGREYILMGSYILNKILRPNLLIP